MSVAMRKFPVVLIKVPTPLRAGLVVSFRESWAWTVTVIAPTVTSFIRPGTFIEVWRGRV